MIIPGIIHPFLRFGRKITGSSYSGLKHKEAILDPDAIADAYWVLHQQPRNAWTFEMDLRPWVEDPAYIH